MKCHRIALVLYIVLIAYSLHARETFNFNTGWKFTQGDPANAQEVGFNDSNWESVRIPHDWAIAGPFDPKGSADTGKLPWKGQGWYRKDFTVPGSLEGKQVYFIFDGIMAFPQVYINGQPAGSWDYGYNSFYLNVTRQLNARSENLIAIHVDTREHDSRWYPGAGIYRKITMLIVDDVHVPVWGTYVTTPQVADNWTDVRMQTEVRNDGDQPSMVVVQTSVLSPTGHILARDTISATLGTGRQHSFEQWFTLAYPEKWDVDRPVLYRMRTTVYKNGIVCDTYTTSFGVRTFRFTANDGFYLNGRRLQMKGVNLHHDHGPLGAKFYPRAMERQIEIMKSMGVNALRNSHNVAAPEFLSLCDSMGIIVFNESHDKWDGKADILPETDFDEYMERNLRNFVRRDRNHPSVVIWSVGNEMRDVQGNSENGLQKLAKAVNVVRLYDPTRPITIACDQENGVRWRHFDYYDVHSWNYGRRYLPAREAEPGKAVIISESASTVSTRGFYEFPLPLKPTDFTDAGQVSSYDLHAPWWAEIPEEDFFYQENDHYVVGEYVWTGFDYLGEPTPYNDYWARSNNLPSEKAARSSYFGIVDLCGIPKDRYYLYKSYWKPKETTVHILPHWNWPERAGKTTPVFVYTNGDCAELFLNGVSQGLRCKEPKSDSLTERYRLMWTDVTYQAGELRAVAYKEGVEIGEYTMRTAGEPTQLRLMPDRTELSASGEDLSYILVEAVDDEGNVAPLANQQFTCNVTGTGTLEAIGNGNPQSLESYVDNIHHLFYGKAMIIVRTSENAGTISVEVTANGFGSAVVELHSH